MADTYGVDVCAGSSDIHHNVDKISTWVVSVA